MSVYAFAAYFWSVVAVALVLVPFGTAVVRRAILAMLHAFHHANAELASLPSVPRPSRP